MLSAIRLVVWELKLEFKTPAILITFLFFSVSLASLFHYAFPVRWTSSLAEGGYLIVLFFLVTLVTGRAGQRDREASAGPVIFLAASSRWKVYAARVFARALLFSLVILFYFPIHMILLTGQFQTEDMAPVLIPGLLLSVTLAALASMVAMIASGNRFRELVMPVIFFPAALPAFMIHASFLKDGAPGFPALVVLAILYLSVGYAVFTNLKVDEV